MEFALPRGPVDIAPNGIAFAFSCARLVNRSYKGPLVKLTRSSDSATQDFWPDARGNLPVGACLRWANGSTLTVNTLYDQSGNKGHATNSTVANQPSLVANALNGRPGMLFTNGGALDLTASPIAGNQDIFAAGGTVLCVVMPTANPNQTNRIASKASATNGWIFGLQNAQQDRPFFSQGAPTTAGSWSVSANGTNNAPQVLEINYSASANANVPVFGMNGASQAFTSIQPVGTIGSDSALSLSVGSNGPTGGTRGFPGYIAELFGWKIQFALLAMAAMRRNCESHFLIGGT